MDALQYLLSMEPMYIPTDRALGFVSTDGPGRRASGRARPGPAPRFDPAISAI